jgi:ABC-type multidrug transport system fused ATPase/permease subunit
VHLTLGILRKSQAVFYALPFFQLDGFAVPTPAQVTQTVGRLRASKHNQNGNLMTENLSPNELQVQKRKPSKKERMEIRKKSLRRKMEKEMIQGVWKSALYVGLPFFLGFMALAISLSLGSFIVGISGVIVAIKKEAPSARGSIRGTWAVILGVLVTAIFWSLAAYFLWVELTIKWWKF